MSRMISPRETFPSQPSFPRNGDPLRGVSLEAPERTSTIGKHQVHDALIVHGLSTVDHGVRRKSPQHQVVLTRVDRYPSRHQCGENFGIPSGAVPNRSQHRILQEDDGDGAALPVECASEMECPLRLHAACRAGDHQQDLGHYLYPQKTSMRRASAITVATCSSSASSTPETRVVRFRFRSLSDPSCTYTC